MTKSRGSVVFRQGFLIGLIAGLCWVMPLQADPVRLSGWQQTAFQNFQNDKYPETLNALESHKQERFARILTTFVHMQEWVYSQSKMQKEVWVGEYKQLAASMGINDIPYLGMIANERDKPTCVKYAKKLLKRSFENIYANEDVPMLVEYLASSDQDVSSYAMKTLTRILKARRKVVAQGGSLRSKDIKMMKDKALLAQLTAIVGQQPVGDKQPAFAKGVSKAVKCMVLIEEPTLEVLDSISGINVIKAKEKVHKAINKRKKKYPKSNWYSAVGKERD